MNKNTAAASIHPVRLQEIQAFLNRSDFAAAELLPLAGDASFRRYIRLRKNGRTAMLMDAPPGKEDVRPYVTVAQYLCGKGYSAPKILAQDAPAGLLLLEDLGDDSFTSVLRKSDEVTERELYSAAVDVLVEWHDGARNFSDPQALAVPAYDEALLLKEATLFSNWYLPQILGKDAAGALSAEYTQIWRDILKAAPLLSDRWVHRDYHADNLMWLPERENSRRVGLLDFQDGVYGDAAYDLVSLLEDARRDVPESLAMSMIERYLSATGADSRRFMTAYAVLGAQRNSKIVGIFSRLAARDGKFSYLDFLPRVWRYLEADLAHPSLGPLKKWLDEHVPSDRRGVIAVRHTSKELALTA